MQFLIPEKLLNTHLQLNSIKIWVHTQEASLSQSLGWLFWFRICRLRKAGWRCLCEIQQFIVNRNKNAIAYIAPVALARRIFIGEAVIAVAVDSIQVAQVLARGVFAGVVRAGVGNSYEFLVSGFCFLVLGFGFLVLDKRITISIKLFHYGTRKK